MHVMHRERFIHAYVFMYVAIWKKYLVVLQFYHDFDAKCCKEVKIPL